MSTELFDIHIQNLHLVTLTISLLPMLIMMLLCILLGKCNVNDLIFFLEYIGNIRYINNEYDNKITEDIAIITILSLGIMFGCIYYFL